MLKRSWRSPSIRFGRNYEVRMRELEQAVASPRPMESSLLGMIHARLLASRKELKAMRVGEDKFPYRFVHPRRSRTHHRLGSGKSPPGTLLR